MIQYHPAPLDHVIDLLGRSPFYHNFSLAQATRLFIPPVNLRQNIGRFENGYLTGWVSWMFTDREKADKFLDGNHKIMPEDWSSGDVLVFVDFVTPYGHARELYRECRNLFPNYPKAEWRRFKNKKRINSNLRVKDAA